MKIYIWEGEGISDSYCDDGILIVLANSPDEARDLVRKNRETEKDILQLWFKKRDAFYIKNECNSNNEEWVKLLDDMPSVKDSFNGTDEALDREPDRIIGVNNACIIAFKSGSDG